jgi:hypothetical protein
MTEAITWSVAAGSASSSAINSAGSTQGDATVSVSLKLDAAAAAPRVLALQVDDVTKVTFLAISSSLYDGTVEVKGTGAALKLTGPILLFGAAVALFANDLSALTVQNKSPTKSADFSVLIGMTL